jgi:diguanylate cyclase (GGDEF)-like protein
LSCCFVDLDGFNRVNDERGHVEGNQVLSAIGAGLRDVARRYDIVSRFGGDEFLVVLPETSARSARAIGLRVQASIRAAVAATTRVPVDASIGIADWDGTLSAFALIDAADRNMREAKLAGGGGIVGATAGRRTDLLDVRRGMVRPWRGRQP